MHRSTTVLFLLLSWLMLLSVAAFSSQHLPLKPFAATDDQPCWAHRARIAGIGPDSRAAARQMVEWAAGSGVSVLEIDVEVNNTYENFQDPSDALALLAYADSLAKEEGMHTFCYLSGFEIITRDADPNHDGIPDIPTVYTDHPDWLQMSYAQEDTAVFYGAWAFWLEPEDESAWVTPWNMEWRDRYLEIAGWTAQTGVDAIFIDVPYMMTHFDGWEDTWASFDPWMEYEYGQWGGTLPPRQRVGDFDDPRFRSWIDFRYHSVNTFLDAVAGRIGDTPLAVECYAAGGPDAVYIGCDPYRLASHSDWTGHEYEPKTYAALRGVYEWLFFYTGLSCLRALDGGRPTWILSYVNGDEEGDPLGDAKWDAAMNNLACSLIQNECCYWETGGYGMNSTSAHLEHRGEIFGWFSLFDDYFYTPVKPSHAVGVYFSPASRDYIDWAGNEVHLAGTHGTLMALAELHYEILPTTPASFSSAVAEGVPCMILANVGCMSDAEAGLIISYVQDGGGKLLITDYPGGVATGSRDETGAERGQNALEDIMGHPSVLRVNNSPGKQYFNATTFNPNDDPVFRNYPNATAESAKASLLTMLDTQLGIEREITTNAPPTVIIRPCRPAQGMNREIALHLVNYTGTTHQGNQDPTPVTNLTVTIPSRFALYATALDFLADEFVPLECEFDGEHTTIHLDSLKHGTTIIARSAVHILPWNRRR